MGKVVTILLIFVAGMIVDDMFTVYICDKNGVYRTYFSGVYSCKPVSAKE